VASWAALHEMPDRGMIAKLARRNRSSARPRGESLLVNHEVPPNYRVELCYAVPDGMA
jgi:hypothetical protein